MRLSTIKLSGFKSFVDPTVLYLPTNMTGVVGPNGCGKSNIIDAIRWVMGESAASRLRGDSLTDVIFAGSGNRKPVGTASVELIFDNSDGLIGGEYARFNEISVKRTVSRDGQSNYFLNGGRCRRRDIVDVFLGTGLGPRSYSIIEQGMISQIVEAKPEELRHHLEEAAGISKYKERRKETESRIKATRENLDRLNDVRQEVDKNLEHLNRQAKNAERWQKLKAEANRTEAEVKALALIGHKTELEEKTRAVNAIVLEIEKVTAQQRQVEASFEGFRAKKNAATEHFNQVQAEAYRVGGDIARVEQQIQHNKDLVVRLEENAREIDGQLEQLVSHIHADYGQIEALTSALAMAEPQMEVLHEAANARAESLREAEQLLVDWQQKWDGYAKSSSESARLAEVERTRLDYLDKQSLELAKRLEHFGQERQQLDIAQNDDSTKHLLSEQEQYKARIEFLTEALAAKKSELEDLQHKQRQAATELARIRQDKERAQGRIASLEALQHAALGQDSQAANQALQSLGIGKNKRLGEVIDVEPLWEKAVETVLHGVLDGVLVEDHAAYLEQLPQDLAVNVSLFSDASGSAQAPGTLAEHVKAPAGVRQLLARVYCVDGIAEAKSRLAGLQPGYSVITQAGEWLGEGWSRLIRAQNNQQGVLGRERELHELQQTMAALVQNIEQLGLQTEELQLLTKDAEVASEDLQRELYGAHRRHSEVGGQLQSQQGKVEAARLRLERIVGESDELQTQLAQVETQVKEARTRLEHAVSKMGDLEAHRVDLDAQRRKFLEQREEARMEAREARDQVHQMSLQTEAKKASLQALEQAIARMQRQQETQVARAAEIKQQLAQGAEPQEKLEAERATYLDQRLLVDKQLVQARKDLEALEDDMKAYETERHQVEQLLDRQKELLSGRRLEEQELRLRSETLVEAIAQVGFNEEAIIAELPKEAELAAWHAKLEDLEAKIKRLEPVNLAAIQEFAELSERKTYLDAQLADLNLALETLESAIKKIDKETRTRFKETFDKVNQGLSELFPRLFGGGHAYLELTGDDLLDTGASIMARPPGKRISSISLLSGGEKALTAVALVFAIFRLNPAPFCLLDEVDAPLDEANVGRFCQMVKEMSEHVQFVMVTHNKVTMETTTQLCGVTMREPGVSRLVQVDLEEAAKLAGAA